MLLNVIVFDHNLNFQYRDVYVHIIASLVPIPQSPIPGTGKGP